MDHDEKVDIKWSNLIDSDRFMRAVFTMAVASETRLKRRSWSLSPITGHHISPDVYQCDGPRGYFLSHFILNLDQ